jgi:hypothetical protein
MWMRGGECTGMLLIRSKASTRDQSTGLWGSIPLEIAYASNNSLVDISPDFVSNKQTIERRKEGEGERGEGWEGRGGRNTFYNSELVFV